MRTDDFDYELPQDRIAQHPAQPRDSSRLLVLNRESGELHHHIFHDLPSLLTPGDALVLNQTRVLPARLRAVKADSGGQIEILLLRQEAPTIWQAMVGGKRVDPGRRLLLNDGLGAEVLANLGGPRRRLRFDRPLNAELEHLGEMPLPPYIHEPLSKPDDYQTVYAEDPGSAAAPTAGLHFTPQLLANLQEHGVHLVRLTLHVGMDTFAPVRELNPIEHAIHSEWCELSPQAAETLNTVRASGGRIIPVGTTSVRTLETAVRQSEDEKIAPFRGNTDLYILPGFTFKATDAMVTNFHLPRSTLLMLVSAFAGHQRILETYRLAIEDGYRFYSFGDAMLIE
ncbi:MAG: tRNA preQ1(34) S-adenosylmethionine ribosyltransferase-isomerase QueA [Anaerolineales bacterium]